MPFAFSETSRDRLQGAHRDLQKLANLAIKLIDFTVLETNRTEEQQQIYVAKGVSQTMSSKHLPWPSQAMDIAPWFAAEPHIRWPDTSIRGAEVIARWAYLIGIIRGAAAALGIAVRVGFDWDGDGNAFNEHFPDWPHVEVKGK